MTSGRKSVTGKPSHQAAASVAATPLESPESWPTSDQVTARFDTKPTLEAGIAALTADQVHSALNGMPADYRRFVLQAIGLRSAASVNRGMAAQLIARIRTTAAAGNTELLADLVAPILNVFSQAVTTTDWTAMSGRDHAAAFDAFARNAGVAFMLDRGLPEMPDSLVKIGLAVAINHRVARTAMALAFLATVDTPARLAYQELRSQHGQLPPVPVLGLAEVGPRQRLLSMGVPALLSPSSDDVDYAGALEAVARGWAADAHEVELVGDGAWSALDDGVLAGALDDLLDRDWAEVARVVRHLGELLDEGGIPEREDADAVATFVKTLVDLEHALKPSSRTRGGLREALARQARVAAGMRDLLRLEAIVGADGQSEQIAEIRAGVRATVADPAAEHEDLSNLLALFDLVALHKAGQPVDFDRADEIRAAIERSRPSWGVLLNRVMMGVVTLAEDGQAAVPTPPDPSPPPSSGDGERPEPVPDGEPLRHEAPAPDDRPAEAPEAAGTGTAAPDDDGSSDDPDLAELDALLDSGSGARLAALAGRRPATRPPTRPESEPVAPVLISTPVPAPTRAGAVADAWRSPASQDLQHKLIAEGRFALAADLAIAMDAPESSVAARRLGVYAQWLRRSTGPMASAFAAEVPRIRRDDLGDDRDGQLLAWVSSAKIALLAPSAGPATVLIDLAPCVAGLPTLAEIGAALADASRSGAVVFAEMASQVGALASAETELRVALEQAQSLLRNVRQYPLKYRPANGVYRAWMAPEGVLGRLLGRVVEESGEEAVASIRDEVVRLRGAGERQIDDTFAAQRGNRQNRIIFAAREKLLSRWTEALDVAERWTDAMARLAEHQDEMRVGAWLVRPLDKLRKRLSPLDETRTRALRELAGADLDPNMLTGTSRLLYEALAVCDGHPPTGEEPSIAFAEHAELLGGDLPLSADTLRPDGGIGRWREELVQLAAAERLPADQVYRRRADAGDHDLTVVLMAGLRAVDPSAWAELREQLGRDWGRAMVDKEKLLNELRREIDTRRMEGALTDDEWVALSSRAEALSTPEDRRDLRRVRELAAAVRRDLNADRQGSIDEVVARVAQMSNDSQVVAGAADHIVDLARKGKVAAAEEYLENVRNGRELPRPGAEVDHFRQFFPAVPEIAARHPDPMALVGGGTGSRTEVGGVGLDFAALADARRQAAKQASVAWRVLAGQVKRTAMTWKDALRAVLAQAGLEFEDAVLQPTGAGHGRRWIELSGVRGTGEPLTPVLGSAMSPDGRTLRILQIKEAPTPATVIEWMRDEPRDQTVLAIWQGKPLDASERRVFADAARGRPRPPVLLFDAAVLLYLMAQAEPRRATLDAITLPFTAASPYQDTPGDTAPEMFYGRVEELHRVLDMEGSSFVSGGRQLGKSALLRMAGRRFEQSGAGRVAVFVSLFTVGADGSPERLWRTLWRPLVDRGICSGDLPPGDEAATVHDAIISWVRDRSDRMLLILLDEADTFLEADAGDGTDNSFVNVDWFRRLRDDSNRRVKVVFAGLHRTIRFEPLPNQPLSHLGTTRPVVVGPLQPQHAHDLLTRPLKALGFRFADEVASPAKVLAWANNLPALLQLFGEALVTHLTTAPVPGDGPPQDITDDDLDTVFADPDLQHAFREKYVLTLNLDHRYLLITYLVAAAAHERGVDTTLSQKEIIDQCRLFWPAGFLGCGTDDFAGLIAECVDLGILAKDDDGYRVRTPTVLRLLGTEDEVLEMVYGAAERLTVSAPSDALTYRRPLGSSRSPLTQRQLGRVFSADRAVTVIAGSPALGLSRVMPALQHAYREGDEVSGGFLEVKTLTPDGLRSTVGRVTSERTLLALNASGLSTGGLRALLDVAQGILEETNRSCCLAVIAAPDNAAAWIGMADRVDLAPVDPMGLRLWYDEANLPFRDDETRGALLRLTGGWLSLLEKAARIAVEEGPTVSAGRVLERLGAALPRESDAILEAAGVHDPESCLGAAFRVVAGLTESTAEFTDALSMVVCDPEWGGVPCEPEEFSNPTAVVNALIALGCLRQTETGRWMAEPVLAKALKASGKNGR